MLYLYEDWGQVTSGQVIKINFPFNCIVSYSKLLKNKLQAQFKIVCFSLTNNKCTPKSVFLYNSGANV